MDRIFTCTGDGTIQIHNSDGTVANNAYVTGLDTPVCLTLGPGGSLWGTDVYVIANGELLRIDSLGNSTTLGNGFGQGISDLKFGVDGSLYLSDFDNDRILRIIPEPQTLLLLTFGIPAILRRRKR